jgi:hypothetical protein
VAQLEAEKTTTPKPRCDAQGRLLELPLEGEPHYWVRCDGVKKSDTHPHLDSDKGMLAQGHLFISQPAAEAELTRLKCLQRLRGMEGFNPFSTWEVCVTYLVILNGFETQEQCNAAEATIIPEERAAFLYREPTKE